MVRANALSPKSLLHAREVGANTPVDGTERGLELVHAAPNLRARRQRGARCMRTAPHHQPCMSLHARKQALTAPASECQDSIRERLVHLLKLVSRHPEPTLPGLQSDAPPPPQSIASGLIAWRSGQTLERQCRNSGLLDDGYAVCASSVACLRHPGDCPPPLNEGASGCRCRHQLPKSIALCDSYCTLNTRLPSRGGRRRPCRRIMAC